jgi:glycosyltransferase involved in cell wall biosynthesis
MSVRLGILSDFLEERWPSMDVCSEMLQAHTATASQGRLTPVPLTPVFRRRFGRIRVRPLCRLAFNVDRYLNRYFDYPRFLHDHGSADLYHIVDHSYAHLVHALPARRCGVFCHDLDGFRCLLDPRHNPRPCWFRRLMSGVLSGLRQAAVVFHSTQELRRQIERFGIVDPDRLVHAPYGISPEFSETARAGFEDPPADGPYLMHVGSCIPRKRVDVLLDVYAKVRATFPGLRLVQVGGEWTAEQRAQMEQRGLEANVTQLRGLSRHALAALYRRAKLVLQPSEAEGFGLPVIEALACGTVVVASDLGVLREVGGPAVVYCPVGDVAAWTDAVRALLRQPASAPAREERLRRAQQYSWAAHVRTIAETYLNLLENSAPRPLP